MQVHNTVKQHGKRLYSPLARVSELKEKPRQEYARPYVIGICGGPSSGKSTVVEIIKEKLPHAVVLNLMNFYKPVRGNLRRVSRSDSIVEDAKNEEQIKTEIRKVYKQHDFDSPDAIDWALLNKGVQ